jgi:hypothetical protein
MKAISTLFNPHSKELPTRHIVLLFAILSLVSIGAYILTSSIIYRIGFPLDDSWIHQTFARNLVTRREWAFFPGIPSNASTSPLWSALLSVGYLLKMMPYVWTYFLGFMSLWGLSTFIELSARKYFHAYHPPFPWIGTVLIFEWHLVWSAASGMETLFFILLVSVIMIKVISGSDDYLFLGILTGLSVWTRPEGITLLGPIGLSLLFSSKEWKECGKNIVNLVIGFGILFAFYLFFNLALSGLPWPNTFYAKQAEFNKLSEIPYLVRFGREALQPFIGVGFICLPGCVVFIIQQWKQNKVRIIGVFAWILGYIALFAWKLPVTYQYGRYVMPVIPIIVFMGLVGLFGVQYDPALRKRWAVMTFWKILAVAVLGVFWFLGASSYGKDVAYIESEMVTTAKWVSNNLPSDSIIATHDIGAMGYFGNHKLIDLAGLVTPEVIPIIFDVGEISTYLDEEGVDYVVTFSDWYPELTGNLRSVFTTHAPFAPKMGGTNMVVYIWKNSIFP